MPFDKTKLLEKIKKGNLKIKPKWIFLLRALALFLLLIMSALFMLFMLGAVIFFVFYHNNFIGMREVMSVAMIVKVLPWALISAAVAFLILFEISLSKIMPLYRKPIIMVMMFVIAVAIGASFLINRMVMFRKMFDGHPQRPGMARWMIRDPQQKLEDHLKEGVIKKIGDEGEIVVELEEGEFIYVDNAHFGMMSKNGKNIFKPGAEVIISGIEREEGFEVFRIRPKNRPGENRPEINCPNGCNNIWIGREQKPRINKSY